MILKTRDYYISTPEYKHIYRKNSFDNWKYTTEVLYSWGVITSDIKDKFIELSAYRNDSIHYTEGYDFETNSKKALDILVVIVTSLFCATRREDLFWVFDIPGEIWLKSSVQEQPFVKEFIIPLCYKAHAKHEVDFETGGIKEIDPQIGKLTDSEFILLRNKYEKEKT